MKKLFAVFTVLAFGVATFAGGAQAAEKSLFERLGGKPAITAVINQFVDNNSSDKVIGHRWNPRNSHNLKAHLVDLVCEVTGGPCVYIGKSMEISHTGVNVTEDEFTRVAGNLVRALDTFKVPAKEKDELLAIIGSLKDQVVGK